MAMCCYAKSPDGAVHISPGRKSRDFERPTDRVLKGRLMPPLDGP